MKSFPLPLIAGAAALCLVPPFASDVLASLRPQDAPAGWTTPENEYLLGRDVVVTVDPLDSRSDVYAGDANIITGFVAPDTVRGTLIRMNPQWLVLEDGRNENWIPRHKVLLIHTCQ